MNGFGVSGETLSSADEAEREELVRSFHGQLMGLFDSMRHLHAFAQDRRQTLTQRFDAPIEEDPLLRSWMEAAIASGRPGWVDDMKEAAFGDLVEWFRG
jgi:hypothetical protein